MGSLTAPSRPLATGNPISCYGVPIAALGPGTLPPVTVGGIPLPMERHVRVFSAGVSAAS
jgi:hypothetical protein